MELSVSAPVFEEPLNLSDGGARDITMLINRYFHSVYTPNPSSFPKRGDLTPISNSLQSISISNIDVFEGFPRSLDPTEAKGLMISVRKF